MSETDVIIVEVPGGRKLVTVADGATVADACESAGIAIDNREIRVDGVSAGADATLSGETVRVTLNRGAKGNH